MRMHDAKPEIGGQSDGLGSGKRTARLKLGAHSRECSCLFLWRRDLRDGTQSSFGEEAGLVIREIQQGVKDFWCELQEVECLGDSCSGYAQMSCQIRVVGTSALFEYVLENQRLFHRIDDGCGRFLVDRSRLSVCGSNRRYEKLALVQSRKVNPEGYVEKVRESFGRAEPFYFNAVFRDGAFSFGEEIMPCWTHILQNQSSGRYKPLVPRFGQSGIWLIGNSGPSFQFQYKTRDSAYPLK